MKKCIWCLQQEGIVSFNKISHVLPQSLGSNQICEDVCDTCNEFLGKKTGRLKPSIDIALKELLVLSKYQRIDALLKIQNQLGKTNARRMFGQYIDSNIIQTLNRDTEFFVIEQRDGKMGFRTTKAFDHHCMHPTILTNRLKRGLFKVAFEVAHIEALLKQLNKDFYHSDFHYIRDFVRSDIGNLKLYYLQRKIGAEILTIDIATRPQVLLHELEDNYIRIEVLGHTFAFSIGKANLTEHLLLRKYQKSNSLLQPVLVHSFLDIDIFNRVYSS